MASSVNLPDGFVLDNQPKGNNIPDGFVLDNNQKPSLIQDAFTPISKLITGKSVGERTDFLNKRGNQNVALSDLNTQRDLQKQSASGKLPITTPKTPGQFGMFMNQLPSATAQAVTNMADLTPFDVATAGATKGLANTGFGKFFGNVITKDLTPGFAKPIEDKIFDLYNSAIGTKIKNPGDLKNIKSSRVNVVKTISENLPEIKLPNPDTGVLESRAPQNRSENLDAYQQAKQLIWKKATDLSQGATESGAQINLSKLVDSALLDAKKNIGEVALETDKNLAVSLEKEANDIKSFGSINPSQAQDYLKSLNDKIKVLYKSNVPVDYSVKDLLSNLRFKLANETDNVIESTLNKSGYKDLRKQYADLRGSQNEILGSANKYLRQAGGQSGTHPIVDLWSLEELMQSGGHLLTGNPLAAAGNLGRAAAIKASSKLLDFMRSPDKKISQMYELAQKYVRPTSSVVHTPEILNTRQSPQQILGIPERKFGALPSPKDVPYNPSGQRVPGGKPIITPSAEQNPVIPGENPIKKLDYKTIITPPPTKEIKGGMTKSSERKFGEISTPKVLGAGAVGVGLSSQANANENIDMNKIFNIESSMNPKAENKKSGAIGLGQITPVVLKEWNNINKEKYSKNDLYDPKVNSKISDWYINKRIPEMLNYYKIPDNTKNRLIAYNAGISYLIKNKKLPQETINYIKKYEKK
jgi:hypothetical protein